MKVVLVNGSPHEKGCTYTALTEVSNTLRENGVDTEFFWIGNKPVGGCIACHKCRDIGRCVFNDVSMNSASWPFRRTVRFWLTGALCSSFREHDSIHGPCLLL